MNIHSQVMVIDSNNRMDSHQQELWYQAETLKNGLSGVWDTSFIVEDGIVSVTYDQGKKRAVVLRDTDSLLIRKSLFNSEGLVQELRFDRSGTIRFMYQLRDGIEYFLSMPDDPGQGSVSVNEVNELSPNFQLNFDQKGNVVDYSRKLNSHSDDEHSYERYHPNGQLAIKFRMSYEGADYTRYFDNGKVNEMGKVVYFPSSKVSCWKEWYEDGSVYREYCFDENTPNQREGDWKWYDRNGKVYKWEVYRDGSLIRVKVGGKEGK